MQSGDEVDERLSDIVAWGTRLESHLAGLSVEQFMTDLRTQDAAIRCLEVVGEACSRLLKADAQFEARHPELALSAAYRARNRTAHGYGSVDPTTIWRSATVSCPLLVAAAKAILEKRQGRGSQ